MSLTHVQQNIATEMQSVAEEILSLKNRLSIVVTMYAAEVMASLTDADYQEYQDLAHVTSAEMASARTAIDAINTAIGDYVAGANALKLMRIVRIVPK